MNKKKKAFDWGGWVNWAPKVRLLAAPWHDLTNTFLKTTPQQENGFDCGVFTCQILRAVSRGDQTFVFSQKDMSYLRRRMIWEIGHAKLRDGYSWWSLTLIHAIAFRFAFVALWDISQSHCFITRYLRDLLIVLYILCTSSVSFHPPSPRTGCNITGTIIAFLLP